MTPTARTETPQPKQPEPRDLELLDWTVSLSPQLKQFLRDEKKKMSESARVTKLLDELKERLD